MGIARINRATRGSRPRLTLACSSLLLYMLSSCASLPQQAPVSADDLVWVAAGAGMLSASSGAPIEDSPSLMHVSDEMRRFAQEATRAATSVDGKASALALALSGKKGLNLQFDAEATLTAQEAFKQRRANCLSYTMLFVALARELGIPAKFNEVEIPPIWDFGDDNTSLLYLHINARVDLTPPFFQIVDVNGEEYDPSFPQSPISDAAAQAQFYNNRSVELRLQRHYADAVRYQIRALALDPDAAYLWTNLASLYLQSDSLRAARIAATKALTLDTSRMLSYDTAALIYDKLGDAHLAAYFHERAQYFIDQNPYYHYQLALAALREHNDSLAYDETRHAIEMYRKEPRFFFLMAVLLDRLGEKKLAYKSMQIAIELTPDTTQQQRYRSKFARLTNQG
ncbi:MAG: tetratricopeptide repeat protein [Nevskia sp.]|nr:tetratricopeptide repeat protein [Nevskia sp.]